MDVPSALRWHLRTGTVDARIDHGTSGTLELFHPMRVRTSALMAAETDCSTLRLHGLVTVQRDYSRRVALEPDGKYMHVQPDPSISDARPRRSSPEKVIAADRATI